MDDLRAYFSHHYGQTLAYDDDQIDLGSDSLSIRMLTSASLKRFRKRRLSYARNPREVFYFPGRFYQILFSR